MDIAKQVARASFEAGAITVNANEPFTGASGVKLPIYNDNRKLLGSYAHRQLVAHAYADFISRNNISFDMIAGTSLSGIAPATSVAAIFKVPLVMLVNNEPFHPLVHLDQLRPHGAVDIIVSSAPWSIAAGTVIANRYQLPFAYVRSTAKEHGLQQQIEGKYSSGQMVHFIDLYAGESNAPQMLCALKSKGLRVNSFVMDDIGYRLMNVRDQRILLIEDLISTGGSAAKEADRYAQLGAVVENCIALYGNTPTAFGASCKPSVLVSWDDIIAVAPDYLDADKLQVLRKWREDPLGWGAKNVTK